MRIRILMICVFPLLACRKPAGPRVKGEPSPVEAPAPAPVPTLGEVRTSVRTDDRGRKLFGVENDFLGAEFAARGGKCVSLKVDGKELAGMVGIFEEHLSTQSYPRSDFRRAEFSVSFAKESPDEAILELAARAASEDCAGLEMKKTIRFTRGPRIDAEVTLANAGDGTVITGLWSHHSFGTKGSFTVPDAAGIKSLPYDPASEDASESWTREPARAWTAFAAEGSVGVAFVVDWESLGAFYNYLSPLYASAEWRTVEEKLKAGEKKTYAYSAVVFKRLDKVSGAGEAFVGEMAPEGLRLQPASEPGELEAVFKKVIQGRLCRSVSRTAVEGAELGRLKTVAGAGDVVELASAGERLGEVFAQGVAIEPLEGRRASVKRPRPGRKDIVYSIDVPTRHVPWGRPYYRGTMKAFVLSPVRPNGDTTEFLKRFDVDYDVVTVDPSWEMNTWGMGDHYGRRSNKDSQGRDMELAYVSEDITSPAHYDVMVIPTVIGWNTYPERARRKIMERVEAGAGLVLISPQDCEERPADEIVLGRLSPLTKGPKTRYHWYGDWQRHFDWKPAKEWKKTKRHFVTDGLPLGAVPVGNVYCYPFEARGEVLLESGDGTPIIVAREHGKGRVIGINWTCGHKAGLTPEEWDKGGGWRASLPKLPGYDYWEYFYSVLGRASLWAAGFESEFDVLSVSTDAKEYASDALANGKLTVEGESRLPALDVEFEVTFRDERSQPEHVLVEKRKMETGPFRVELALPEGLKGGTHLVDVIARADRFSLNWGSAFFRVKPRARIESVTVEQDAVRSGDRISGKVGLADAGGGLNGKLVIELRDPYGRLLAESTREADLAAGAEQAYSFEVRDFVALVGFVRAKAVVGEKVEHELDSSTFVVTPPEPSFTDYDVAPWGFASRRNLWEVKAAQFRNFGVTMVADVNEMAMRYGFGAKGQASCTELGIYYYNRARGELEERWKAYRASKGTVAERKKHCWRRHCLSKPEIREGIRERVRERASSQKKYNPGTYYIGDESSLTSYGMEADLCFTDECTANFCGWLKGRYGGSLEDLNARWQSRYKSWDEIVPPTIVEAEKDEKLWVAWAEHRTFMEELYEGVFKLIRETAKSVDPNAEMELTGTQGPKSFNGADWARITRHVKRYVPYSGNHMWDMVRSFAPDAKMVGLTGYGSTGDGVKRRLWDQAFHGLLGANIFWEWSLVDADMTLSQNAVDIGEVFFEMRSKGIGRLLSEVRWEKNDVAIHYSMPSVHLGRLQKREGEHVARMNAWCDAVADLGLQYDLISYLQIEEGKLGEAGYRALVLPGSLAVSEKEKAEIEAFVRAGGAVISDTEPGLADDRCDLRKAGMLKALFPHGGDEGYETPVGAGKAVYLGKTFTGYGKERLKREGGAVRAELRALLDGCGVEPYARVTVAGKPIERSEVFHYSDGRARYTAVLKEDLGGVRKTTPDGVEYFEPFGEDAPKPVEEVTVSWKETMHVYDARAGRHLGRTKEIKDTVTSAEAKLYARLPYKVEEVELRGPGEVARGKSAAFELSITAEGEPTAHVFHVEVEKPDGEVPFYLTKNVYAPDGKVGHVVPIALNDPAGTWRLLVRDAATGVASGAAFEVE